MKKKVRAILIVFLVLSLVTIVFHEIKNVISKKKDDKPVQSPVTTEVSVEEACYSYNDVEDMVARLASDDETEAALDRLIDPLTASQSINVLYIKNVVSTIKLSSDVYSGVLGDKADEALVTVSEFDEIYHNIADTGMVDGLSRHDIFVYKIITDEVTAEKSISDGLEEYSLDIDVSEQYLNKIIDVYIKNDRVFKINGYGNSQYVIENAFLVSIEENKCTILYDDMTKNFDIPMQEATPTDSVPESIVDAKPGSVVKVTVDNNGVVAIEELTDVISARVLSVSDTSLSVENHGNFTYDKNFRIYNNLNGAYCESSIPIITGYKNVNIYKSGDKAIAAIVDEEIVSEEIRVILSNDSYSSYEFSTVQVTSQYAFKVVYSAEEEQNYNAGDVLTINYSDYEDGQIISIEPIVPDGKLQVLNLNRSCGNPTYSGRLVVNVYSEYLNVINVVSIETYLYSVVSSMASADTPDEALKALAVCARGYAYSKFKDGSFSDYKAHLDDSSLCQLYGDAVVSNNAIKAVKDTYNIVPVYDGTVIVPLTFSTSCGMTCTNEEIWGGSAYPYLESNVETMEKETIDLSAEEDFISFMEDSMGYDTIEKDLPFYRWSISYTKEEISQAINSMLEERISMSADNIKIMDEDGDFESGEITDIGQVNSITVTERSVSGVVTTLVIEGSEATIQVTGQTNVRNLITPVNQQIVRQDEKALTGWTSLPSPFYYIESTDVGYVIHGGGFGHGAGMSQNGATILANEGYNYKYILRHYYSYIDFSGIYDFTEDTEESE